MLSRSSHRNRPHRLKGSMDLVAMMTLGFPSFADVRKSPWAARPIARFKRRDSITQAFSECNIVPAIQQSHATDLIDRKSVGAIAARNRLLFQIDGHREPRRPVQSRRYLRSLIVRDDRSEQAVLRRIARKDVAK